MIFYYLKFAWRHLRKNISYSFINITGLALGIASVLLIFIYIQHEFSYDDYNSKKDRIYRLLEHNSRHGTSSIIETPLVQEMRTSFTGVQDAVSFARPVRCAPMTISVENETFEDIDIRCTESNIFNIFSFPLAAGASENVLDAPNAAVISRSLANKIFGDKNPVGQTFQKESILGERKTFEITAVMEDIPEKTHFKADLFISYHSLTTDGQRQAHSMYVLLKETADKEAIATQAVRYMQDRPGQDGVQNIELQPLEDIYLSNIGGERQGNINYIYILSAIAFIILIIGCANYMNLATARYSKRSKEIGVRKVMGAYRMQLVRQFLFETVLLTLLALPLALLLIELALPYFNFYVGTSLSLSVAGSGWFYLAMAGIIAFTGLLAGSYPALVSSAFEPREVISGTGGSGISFTGSGLRKGLVGFQFLASIVLIGMTMVVIQQLSFVQEKDLGFNPQNIVTVPVDMSLRTKYDVLKQQFRQVPSVREVTATPAPGAGGFGWRSISFTPEGNPDNEISLVMQPVDQNFISTMNIPLVAGRNIASHFGDSALTVETLINETAVEALGYKNPDSALGETIPFGKTYRIVGVVKDFHFNSLKEVITPALFPQISQRGASGISVKLVENADLSQTLEQLRAGWKEAGGAAGDFYYYVLQDRLQQQYQQEQRAAKVIGVFAIIAIVIACMGLFGLAAFITQQRMKEIGIRKVLGASISSILLLLYKDFGKLIGIATVLAVPLIYYAGGRWLQNFAYRMDIGAMVILIPLLIVMLISVIATSMHSVRAALMNPVESIRSE